MRPGTPLACLQGRVVLFHTDIYATPSNAGSVPAPPSVLSLRLLLLLFDLVSLLPFPFHECHS
jgi:hypothetical protein